MSTYVHRPRHPAHECLHGRLRASWLGLVCASMAWAITAADAQAQPPRYRWVDENGVVQFSDRPPAGLDPSQYEGPKPDTVGDELARRRAAAQRESEAAREAAIAQTLAPGEAAGAEPPAEIKTIVESRWTCEEARRFNVYFSRARTPGQSFFSAQPDGTFKKVSPAERAALAEQWRQAAELLCSENVEVKRTGPGAEAGAPAGSEAPAEAPDVVERFATSPEEPEPAPEQEEQEAAEEGESPIEQEAPLEPEPAIEQEAPIEPEAPIEQEAPVEPEAPIEQEAPVDQETSDADDASTRKIGEQAGAGGPIAS